jgi:hypothetical protein
MKTYKNKYIPTKLYKYVAYIRYEHVCMPAAASLPGGREGWQAVLAGHEAQPDGKAVLIKASAMPSRCVPRLLIASRFHEGAGR